MLFHVTFVYEAAVVPPRKRNAENRYFLATVPVEVEELSGNDLPVAFRFAEKSKWQEGKGLAREVRWTPELGHWQADLDVPDNDDRDADGHVVAHRRGAEWLADRCDPRSDAVDSGGGNDPFCTLTHRIGQLDKHGPIEGDPMVTKIRSWDREEREAAVRAAAAGMLLVDGVLHERTTEPVYNLKEFRSLRHDANWIEVDRAGGYDVRGRTHFRADERAAVMERFELEGDVASIEVLIPEAIRAPLPEMDLAETADLVLRRLGDALKENDRAFFSAYADVRDALAPVKIALANIGPGRDESPPAGDLAAALQAALPAITLHGYGEHVAEAVELACARYDQRSLDFSDLPAFGP